MRLGRRLRAVVDEVRGTSLLDLGCDHGKVLVAALLERRVERAAGVDLSEKSLRKARELARASGVNAAFLRADGKDVPFAGADVLVIAGLGGLEMIEILKDRVSYPETMIFVPHQDAFALRRFCNDRALYPAKDFTVCERGKFYDVIVVTSGQPGAPYRDDELYTGKNFPETPEFVRKTAARAAALRDRIERSPAAFDALRSEWEAYSKRLR